MIKVVATAIIGSSVWAAIMPDMVSSVAVSVIWGFASGVFWAVQDNEMELLR